MFDRCKGSRDLSPEEMRQFRLIEDAFRDSCLKWGYEEVRTPTLEYLYLFTSTGTLTPSLLGRVYSFLDWDGWSGERVVLRPDGTIPVARYYTESMSGKGLAKLFYLTNIFIFEPTGRETREKWQCGAELIGEGSPLADVELVMLATEVLERLAVKNIRVKVSHAGLVRAILKKLGLNAEESTALFDRILDGAPGVLAELRNARPEAGNILALLLERRGKASGFLKNIRALFNHVPELEPCLDNFIEILDRLEALGCSYRIDLTTGRSFEYYTGLMFQIDAGGIMVGGGGRYDGLVPLLGGGAVPASGFALYLDELMKLVGRVQSKEPLRVLVKAKPGDKAASKEGFAAAKKLREAGYIAELEMGSRQPDQTWTLGIRTKAPSFLLIEPTTKEAVEARTIEEVVQLLKAAG